MGICAVISNVWERIGHNGQPPAGSEELAAFTLGRMTNREASMRGQQPYPTDDDPDEVTLRGVQSGGSDAIIAGVTAATLLPFVQALMSRAADDIYERVRRHLRSGGTVDVRSHDTQVRVVLRQQPTPDAVRELATLDFESLRRPCTLIWDESERCWRPTG